jgi:hypothetical protein
LAPVASGNYTVLPASPISTTTTGSGTGATLTLLWKIIAIVVLTAGEGYTSASAITITGGGGTGGGIALIILGAADVQVVGVLNTTSATNDIIILDGIVFFVNSYN